MGWEEAYGRGDISQEAVQAVLEEAEERCDRTLNLERTPRLQVTKTVTPTVGHLQVLGLKLMVFFVNLG